MGGVMASKRKRHPKKAVRKYADRRAPEIINDKDKFLKFLAAGKAPAQAAAAAGVSRTTVYEWKKDDSEFGAKWVDAVETALDKLETVLFDSALTGEPSNLQFALKWRRRNVYNSPDGDAKPQNNFIVNITLQEQYKRLERLGLTLPVIESDYENVDAADDRKDS